MDDGFDCIGDYKQIVRSAVCALVINTENKILAVSRKDDPNAFGLIGGKVEVDENFNLKNLY